MSAPKSKTLLLAFTLPLLLAAVLGLNACAFRFISEYDPVLDTGTSELHSQLETFLFTMERKAGTPEGTFESNRAFYDQAQAQLNTLKLRAEVQPKSDILVRHYALITDNIHQLAKLHAVSGEKGLHATLLGPARDALSVQFRAITKLHAALRRGVNE